MKTQAFFAAIAAISLISSASAATQPGTTPDGTAPVASSCPDSKAPSFVPSEVRRIALADIIAAAAEATPANYPDADTVILDSVSCEVYEEDGTSVLFDDTYTKVLTEKGRRSEASATLGFDAFYSDLEVVAAEIVKPDGTVVPIDLERNCKIAIDPGMMSSNIYDPNDKKMTVAYPGLEVGDITRLAIIRREKKVRVPGVWADYQTFETFDPILRYTYAVSSPTNNPVRSQVLRDELPGTATVNDPLPLDGGARTLLSWDFANVPQAFAEPSMPPMHTVCQRILLSTLNDWRELSRWYWNLCKPHLDAVTDEMREMVASLTEGVSTEQERIWRIFTWVSQNVRYMGVTTETEAPGHEPHDVSVTFERRHGVCRDKAALLASMLRLAGTDAFPVLIHVGEKRDPDVPMPFFNHAIACVRDADGEFTLMDPTNENTADLLPAYLAGKSYLVATPEGEPLHTSDEVPAAANMVFAAIKAKVDAKGKITLSSKFDFTGLNDSAYRGAFVRMPAERRREFLEGVVRETIPGAKLESFAIEPEDLRDTEAPLVLRLEASARDFILRGDGASLIDLPHFSTAIGYHNFILDKTGLQERRFPFETEEACGAEETWDIEFESLGAPVALPETISFKTNGVTYSQRVTCPDSQAPSCVKLTSTHRIEFNLTSYPASIYKPFKETLHHIDTLSGQVAAFEPSPTPEELAADSRILSAETAYEIDSPTSWTKTVTVHRQILTYAGRRANSELKINYNPAWQSVEILEASVAAPDGSTQLVTDSEINEMDASWASAAPRYPAARTYVVSLPGVEVGSIISTSYRITQTNAPFFSHFHVFNGTTPLDEDTLKMHFTGEAAELLRKRAGGDDDDILGTCLLSFNDDALHLSKAVNEDGSITIVASVVAPPTLPRESHLPDASRFALAADISLGDWTEYAASLRAAIAEATSPANTKRCAEVAASVCDGLVTVADKATAIRDYVARNFRLAGPSFTAIPLDRAVTPADVILADGYGNLLDRAILISALLFDAGIDNSIVFATDDEIEERIGGNLSRLLRLPHPGTFDYPLVEIPPEDDEDEEAFPIYLNDTDQYATLGMTHHFARHALATLPDDPDIGLFNDDDSESDFDAPIKPIFIDGAFEPKTLENLAIRLKANGDAIVAVHKTIEGVGADEFLKRYAEMTPELLSRHHQELVGTIAVSARPFGELQINTNSLPYSLEYEAEVPSLATRTGNVLSLALPHTSSISPFDADERRLPFTLGRTSFSWQSLAVILPKETKAILSMPKAHSWNYSDVGLGVFERGVAVETDDETGLPVYIETTGRSQRDLTTFGQEFYKTLQEMDRQLTSREANLLVIEIEPGNTEEAADGEEK